MDYLRTNLETFIVHEAPKLPTFPWCSETVEVTDAPRLSYWTYLLNNVENTSISVTNKRVFTTTGSIVCTHNIFQYNNVDIIKRLESGSSLNFSLEEYLQHGNIFHCCLEVANVNGIELEIILIKKTTLANNQQTNVTLIHEIMTVGQHIWQPLHVLQKQKGSIVHEVTLNNLSSAKVDLSLSLVGWVADPIFPASHP